ncbi:MULTISPECIES: ABC transporter substrate-binding protein [Flavonifractor]|jgi:multiple sugar transport system substrate-binding protein|uniref:Extracellular solute-binding protein n=1 Tax=Flavonifractor plautii TaxID=292800 RepID=A0A174E0E5_FLAPL|nr:extracellular solute-binding protein [Flavonifractor plautii]ERI76642.1 ABC transporter, solute-binding protein [Clostridium sp. ATCC BAA-442]MDR3860899.1 extracellular solute-binding protein [Flavonifractor sp.]MCB5377511.1 extracellular solute-binding protein [Flavonifractor plautii]MCB5780106.1 extracellular solute-binding protein [Flavonifractor plautii]MCB5855040.1 extracellular solute-binding protein [Flavonifractor plautii]
MNMKKPLALLLAAGMTLGLAACGNGSQGNSESPAPGGETGGSSSGAVELNLWSFNVGGFAEASNWEPIIAAFNEQNPDIKITVTPINYQDGDQKLTSAITAGTGPDIIFEGPERIVGNYAREGLMVDLSDLWETGGSDIAEGISSVSQLDGTYYMYPLSVAAHCMAINYEAFEAAGALQYIDEETRTWTTDNFVKAMEAVRDAAAAGTININTPGIIYCGAQGGDQGTRALVNNLYSDYFVNEDGTAYTANSENNVKALKLLQDMVNNGSMSANASFAAADELQAFANQTCAVSFCWNYANYTQYAAQTQFTPFAMAFPSDDGKPELEMAGPYGFGVFNNKDEAKIEAAKKFVQFVCDDQTVGVEAVKATGFFPVHSDWGDVYTGDADAETRAPFALMSDYLGRYYNLTGGWTEQRGYWWPMLTEIMTTGADVQTAADKYAAQANANIG